MVLLNEYIKRSIFTKLIQQIKRLKNSQKLPVTKKKKNEKVTKLKWICYLLPLSRLTDLTFEFTKYAEQRFRNILLFEC